MFCDIDEAFDKNPLGEQIKNLEREQYKQSLINSVTKEQRMYNNDYSAYDRNKSSQPFINAQGDVKDIRSGTKISDLKNNDRDEISTGSLFEDSLFSSEEASLVSSISSDTKLTDLNSLPPKNKKYNMKDRTHEFYIRNFIKDLHFNICQFCYFY